MADKIKVGKVSFQAAAGNIDLHYDPQGSGIGSADPFFSSVCPGVANSGNMAHKMGAPGDHSIGEVAPTGMSGD